MLKSTKWIVRDTFKQKSIKINKLIEFSYATGVNFLLVYLQKMPFFENTEIFTDEIIIKVSQGQAYIYPSKKSKTTFFTQHIHIGNLLEIEAQKQKISMQKLS